jgi:hypothetical protein
VKTIFTVVDWHITKEERILKIGYGSVEWTILTQDRDHWQEFVNMVMIFWVI